MRNIKTSGLVLVAAFAMSAVAASPALGFSEWRADFPFPVEIEKGVGKVVPVLHAGQETVTCEKSKTNVPSTAITNATEARAVTEYEGSCKAAGPTFKGNCSNVTTKELKIQPGDDIGNGGAGKEPGVLITPKTGTVLAEVKCGIVTIKVAGSLVCENPNPAKSNKGKIVCAESVLGGQRFTQIIVGSTLLRGQELHSGTEKASLTTTEELTFPALVEVEQTL